ncbi:DUF427 domain-containing protein [Caulobacter sp. LjRoot300]|uniref:DUF427 domain-containing protein n=1 Tax=Caulobacter sp. LjRoot300 TaxID=3342321 RepID=UPI003ECD452F
MDVTHQDHPITCAKEPGRVQVLFEGHSIATSDDVLVLREAGHEPVRYFPREHVAMAFLGKTDKVTHCPYKGQASYYTIMRDRQIVENAVWSYEDPLPGMGRIAGRLAFYPEHFDFQVGARSASDTEAADHGRPEAANAPARGVDDVVRHTDSGSGASQAEHWDANVSIPDDEAWEGDDIREDGPSPVAKPYEGTGSI